MAEEGHIQITEFSKETIPTVNWMMEDLFCQYGVAMPWFMLDFDFPDYSERPDWVSGYNFNLDWGEWGYWLPWFNEMLGLLFDAAHLPRWQMPDLSPGSWAMYNDYTEILYDNAQRHYVYGQSGTFTKDEVVEGQTSGVAGYYKWKDGDGYIHVANKSAAAFEDEKIVGADSGAYAYTYEDWWESPMGIYAYAGGEGVGEGEPKALRKRGLSTIDFDTAWDNYQAYTPTIRVDESVTWACYHEGVYSATGQEVCISFNTTSAPADASTITLNIDIDNIVNTSGDPVLKIYKLDEAFEPSHWLTGGTLITSETITAIGVHSYSLTYDNINQGGWSRFRLSLALLEAQAKPASTTLQSVRCREDIEDYAYLEFIR